MLTIIDLARLTELHFFFLEYWHQCFQGKRKQFYKCIIQLGFNCDGEYTVESMQSGM